MTETEELSAEKARDDFERGGRDEAIYGKMTTEGAAYRDAWRKARWAAEDYCSRIAITGAIGTKIADLLDLPSVGDFFRDRRFARRNLNARFNGKAGKGDSFDRKEGLERAQKMVAEGFTRFVLLGAEVGRCFDVRGEWLKRCGFYDPKNVYRNFLLFPHPSGINAWWNSDFNRFRAKRALREFVFSETLATIP